MGFFQKLKEGLQKTRDAMTGSIQRVLNSFTKIDEDLFEELEETMIMSDMGAQTSMEICDRLRGLVKERGVKDPAKIMDLIEEIISDMMGEETPLDLSTKPSVVVVIGVNGAGKTTTIGKLSHQLKSEGKRVLVAAADTFRAAAIDQLEVWTQRAGVEIVKHGEGSDPSAVVFDAISAAIAREYDVVIVDTAGRLQNKKNLMEELRKMQRIIEQRAEGCAIETLLVLDATTGQNAVSQARLFGEVAKLTGIVLTKLDGTAKGGIVISIKNELGIPVKLVGVGEKIEDLQPFNNADFVRALFDHSQDAYKPTSIPGTRAEDVAEDFAEDVEDVVEDAAQDVVEDVTEDVAQDAAADAAQDVAEDVTEDVAQDVTEDAAEEAPAEPEETPAPKPKKRSWWPFGRREEETVEETADETADEDATAADDALSVEEETVPAETPADETAAEAPAAPPADETDDAPLDVIPEEAPLDTDETDETAGEPAEDEAPVEEEKPKKRGWWPFGRKK